MEFLQLLFTTSLLDNAPVLSKTPEVKRVDNCRHDDEWGLTRTRRELLKTTKENYVHWAKTVCCPCFGPAGVVYDRQHIANTTEAIGVYH